MATLIVPKAVVDGLSVNVTDLLKSQHLIPPYQRDYVWQERTIYQLWDDLTEHYVKHASSEQLPNPEGYFMGAMVVIENDTAGRLEVVDGQQRITALSTVASVLYDAVQQLPHGDMARAGFEQRLREMLAKFDGSNWVSNIAFPDPDLQSFFLESCLLQRSMADKQSYWSTPWCVERLATKRLPIYRIKEAIECGYKKWNAFLAGQSNPILRQSRLVSFLRLATECVVVLRITAKSYSNAYAIFESLNNRGIRLSQADLIKNELLKIASAPDRDEIIGNWSIVKQFTGGSEVVTLPDFLHYSYLSRYGRAKAQDLHALVKARVGTTSTNAKGYSGELAEDADALEAVSESFDSTWSLDTINMLKDINNVLGVKMCYPYLLAAYRKHGGDPPTFEGHVRAVMNFVFRYMKVLDGSAETLTSVISDACSIVNQGDPLADVRTLFRNHAPDDDFKVAFRKVSFPNTKLGYFAVYYLEKAQLGGTMPLPHGDGQNLEHIMPKTPTAATWPNALALKTANPDQFKEFLWRVGNLLPLPPAINKSIKNRDISFKINNPTPNHYSVASLHLESPKKVATFLDVGEWTYKSIEDRQRYLADNVVLNAWAL